MDRNRWPSWIGISGQHASEYALGGKSRFSSAIDMKPMFFKFRDEQLCGTEDPDSDILGKMAELIDPENPPNQSEFRKLTKNNLSLGRKTFDKLLSKGERLGFWYSKRSQMANKLEYHRGKIRSF